MTVSYNLDVSSVTVFSFLKLLTRWKGSIYKSVQTELGMWIIAYYIIFVGIRLLLSDENREIYAAYTRVIDKKLDYIPLTFMLGFFVTIVVDRWRNIFTNIGWIENVALATAAIFRGNDRRAILERRAIIRYLVLSQVLVFRDISMRVRRRFPNLESLVAAGFLHEHELNDLNSIDIAYNRYWVPISWATSIVMRAHQHKIIESPPSFNTLLNEIRIFRTNLSIISSYDWVPIPIAYPQVVFLATRVYFLICLFTRQNLPDSSAKGVKVELWFPFMTILQFVFFVGWMKVAEALLNPMGEDEDDFECNFLIDKNFATGLAIVDQTYGYCPEIIPDKFVDTGFTPLYSDDSFKHGVTQGGLVGSAEGVKLADPKDKIKMVEVTPHASMEDLSTIGSAKIRKRSTTFKNGAQISSTVEANGSPIVFGHQLTKVDEENDTKEEKDEKYEDAQER